MRTFDLAPLYRSTVGFDRLFTMLDQVAGFEGNGSTYPPYNIERTGENAYRITVAVAGFSEPEISIEAKQNTLTIKGEKQVKADEKKGEVLYQGIAGRAFERVFQLASTSRSEALRSRTGSCMSSSSRGAGGHEAAPDSDQRRQQAPDDQRQGGLIHG